MWWLFWLAVIAGAIFGLAKLSEKHQRDHAIHVQKRDEERRARAEEIRLAREAFIRDELLGAGVTECVFDGKPALLSAPADKDIRVTQLNSRYTWTILQEKIVPIAALRAIEVMQDDVVEKYTRKVTTPVVVQKKKSAIGRGLVGGVLLGPAGLILGAASGIAPSSKVVDQVRTQSDERIVKGPPQLVLTTRDRDNPFTRIQFENMDTARAWALWLNDQIS